MLSTSKVWVGFSGEICEIPLKSKVKFLALGKLRHLDIAPVSDRVVASG
jgi:hypothetical protein